MDDAATILASADFFDICSDEQRRMLAFASEKEIFARGATLSRSGEVALGAHILVSGRLSIRPDGQAKPYAVEHVGAVISAMALILSKPRPLTVVAETGVETLFVPRNAFMKLAKQSPDLARRAAERIQRDLISYVSALQQVRGKI